MKETKTDKTYRKQTLIKAFVISALALLMLVSIAGASPFAYVVDRWNGPVVDEIDVVDVIDTATNTITASVPGNLEGPGVAVNPAGTKVYVTNYGKNTVSVIDTATNKVTATVPVGNGPYGVAVNPAGTKVYVTNYGKNTVSVIDTATNKVTATVPVGNGPYGVAVNPAGTKVYVTNSGNYSVPGNAVSVIDTATNKVTATVTVGRGPEGVAVTPDGKKVYVTNYNDNTTSVIDTATNMVTATVTVGKGPSGVAVTPNGKKVYVPCSTTTPNEFDESGLVSVIDTATNTVTANVEDGVGNTGGVAVTPDGTKVYVVTSGHTGAGYGLFVINTATNTGTGAVGYGAPIQAFGQFIGPSVIPTPQKPVAAFSASPNTGFSPLAVAFTDQSTGSPNSWNWDFGDKTTSKIKSPPHTYTAAGTYTVTLTASNAAGKNTITKTNYITVSAPINPNGLKLSANGLLFIKIREGGMQYFINDRFVMFNSGNDATIGFGHLIHKGKITKYDLTQGPFRNGLSMEEALDLLAKDVLIGETRLKSNVQGPLTQYQFDALVSIAYNSGKLTDMPGTPLLTDLNKARYDAAANDILKYKVTASGQPSKGLRSRRAFESTLFKTGDYGKLT